MYKLNPAVLDEDDVKEHTTCQMFCVGPYITDQSEHMQKLNTYVHVHTGISP
jgi:hypothetical protein